MNLAKWNEYVAFLRKWFFNPDIQAAEITLSAVAAHFYKDSEPAWLFILGPSSGDKSSICIRQVTDLPLVHPCGDLTFKTFLSGYTGLPNTSYLHRIGNSGILSFKDFTTFLSK